MFEFQNIFKIGSEDEFQDLALRLFRYQFEKNSVYRSYCDLLYINPSDINTIEEIPFLPINFFKTHEVLSTDAEIENTFLSSGTAGMERSKHHIVDIKKYQLSFSKGFELHFGSPEQYVMLALLPSYMEQGNSSLVYMVDHLIKKARPGSGFYLDNYADLEKSINSALRKKEKIFLIGVSYALLDLAESFYLNLENAIVMETGGMKGRRREFVRDELHQILKSKFNTETIYSEYGMTELLSQAYSMGNGIFKTPSWMKVLIRDPEDPFSILDRTKSGGINIIDLANMDSCAFIATQDLGKINRNGGFEILGRFDHSDVRGCNLMVL